MSTTDFQDIYSEHFADVYKYVLSLCHNETLAEDITQETFIKVMQHIEKFNGSWKLYVWLCQIAKNTYCSLIANHKRIVPEIDTDYPDPQSDLETTYLDKMDARRLHTLLHSGLLSLMKRKENLLSMLRLERRHVQMTKDENFKPDVVSVRLVKRVGLRKSKPYTFLSVPPIQSFKGRVVFSAKIFTLKPLTVWIFAVAFRRQKWGIELGKQ